LGGLFLKGFHNLGFLGLIFLILFPHALPLQAEVQTARVLVLNEDQDKYSLGTYLDILRDPGNELTIQEVTSEVYQDQFTPSQEDIPNFGYQNAAYWVRFTVRNKTVGTGEWVLVLGFRNMHYMDLYTPDRDSDTYEVFKSGVMRSYGNASSSFEKLSFELEIPPETEQTFYIRFQNEASMTLPLTLMSPDVYSKNVMVNELLSGAFYGTLLILVVYNSILFALIREKNYLHLALFSLSALGFFLFFHATIFWLFPEMPPRLSTIIFPVVFGFFIMTLVMFVDSFLELKKTLPKMHLIANVLKGIALFTSVVSIFFQYSKISTIQVVIVIIVLPAILVLNIILAWRGNRSAKLLLGSLPVFLVGGILSSLVRLGMIRSSGLTEELLRFGLIWLVAFWSLALADRMNVLKKEADTSKIQIMENEKRLAQYLDSLPVGVVVYDSDAKPRYINRQSKMILNQSGTEIPSNHFMQTKIDETNNPLNALIPDSDTPHPIEQMPIRHAIQQGTSAYFDNIEIDLGDAVIPVEVWTNPLMDENGKISGTVVAFQNIQDRLNQEKQLRRSEEFRQKILQGSSIGTWMNDLVSGEVFWDSRTREIFGIESDQPANLELGLNLIHPEDRKRAQKVFEKAISHNSNGIYAEEKRIIRPDSQVRWISTRGNVIYEEVLGKLQPARMVGIVLDVTTQKQAEKELEESKVQYQNLVEAMNEGLAIVDENMILTYVNPRLAEMLGFTREDMIGKNVGNFFDQENFKIVVDQFKTRVKGHESPYTVALLRKDGSPLYSLVTPAVVLDEKGKFLHSIAVVSDISEQVNANRLLDRRMRERTLEISSLIDVSQILVSQITYHDQLKNILEKLRNVIKYNDASVLLRNENQLVTETFQKQFSQELTEKMVQPFIQSDLVESKFWQNGALFFPDLRSQSPSGHDFLKLTESIFGSVPPEMVSWIGIPIINRNDLIGVLTAHAAQVNFFKPEMIELMQAFANQIAIAFENNRLYKQARTLAAADERNRLARELHDSVTQSLYSVRLYAEAVRSALAAGKMPAADKNLDQLISIARDGMSDLRLLIFELKPPVLEELGLLGAIEKRLEMVETRAGIQTEVKVEGEPEFREDIEIQLYWVIYEALSNVLKHAKAQHVSLKLNFSKKRTTVVLKDDGIGFDLEKINLNKSSGLKNIIDRIEGLGGHIEIVSKPGGGTSIRIVIDNPAIFP
jgi:PAS domain S-box-containing protein